MRKNVYISVLVLGVLTLVGCGYQQRLLGAQSLQKAQQTEDRLGAARALFHRAFVSRMAALEKKYGIEFDRGWWPVISFEIPSVTHPILQNTEFYAQYNVQTQSFTINPSCLDQVALQPSVLNYAISGEVDQLNVKLANGLSETITHELAHALADQFARRLGRGSFPRSGYGSYSLLREVGADMLCEGIARYVEYDGRSGFYTLQLAVPEVFDEQSWQDARIRMTTIYEGGRLLVAPMIQRFGLRKALEYFYDHPFVPQTPYLRREVLRYQDMALRDIALPKPIRVRSK
jgi:hypothetical protein